MQVFNTIHSLKKWRAQISGSETIGFVPTMGHLHEGHKKLLERSIIENQHTVHSIFVNPTQFNKKDDLIHYPRTIEEDKVLAESVGVDLLFLPSNKEMYADDYKYQVTETMLSERMEGAHRPGHFQGVLTVILKFLMLIRPSSIYLGEKDYQQYALIKGMAEAFFLDLAVVSCATERSKSGLALSSRNSRLSKEQIKLANRFPEALGSNLSLNEIKEQLSNEGFIVDYIEEYQGRRYGAVWVDQVRLIDNKPLG